MLRSEADRYIAGNQWEVLRQVRNPEHISAAFGQARMLVDSEKDYVKVIESPSFTQGLIFIRVETVPLAEDRDMFAQIPELWDLHADAASHSQEFDWFGLNIYEPGGRVGFHRDKYAGVLTAIGLAEVGDTTIFDPVTGRAYDFRLQPGDGLRFTNSVIVDERSRHAVFGDLDERWALVN